MGHKIVPVPTFSFRVLVMQDSQVSEAFTRNIVLLSSFTFIQRGSLHFSLVRFALIYMYTQPLSVIFDYYNTTCNLYRQITDLMAPLASEIQIKTKIHTQITKNTTTYIKMDIQIINGDDIHLIKRVSCLRMMHSTVNKVFLDRQIVY